MPRHDPTHSSLPPVDPKVLGDVARSLGPDLARDLVGVFQKQSKASLDTLAAALAANDADGTRRAAHTLRGSALAVGATRAARVLAEIESRGTGDLSILEDALQKSWSALQTLPQLGPDPARPDPARSVALLVEDDVSTRHLASATLRKAGFDVDAVADGEAALARFEDDRHELVLCDIGLPGISGLEVCRRLRATHPALPILLVTADDRASTIEQAFESGATDFAVKPLQPTLLSHRLRFLHRAHRAVHVASAARLSAREAQRRTGTMSVFLTSMSHELRTPLNAILGYSELLLDELEPDTSHAADVGRIHEAGSHLLGLVNNLLDLSSVQAGRLQLDLRAVPLASLLQRSRATVQPLFERRGLSLDLSADPGIVVRADPDRLQQILVNLLANAAKFTEQGGATVSARVHDSRVRIAVRDTGRGIDDELLGRLFQPFERGAGLPSAQSTGLGLAISRTLATAMQGDLTVESTVGEGSCFTLLLPREHTA